MDERLTSDALERELQTLSGWVLEGCGIRKHFDFTSYSTIIEFVNQVSRVAERMNHHPDMLVKYGSVDVMFTTHSAGGLTQTDFDAARAVDGIFAGFGLAT